MKPLWSDFISVSFKNGSNVISCTQSWDLAADFVTLIKQWSACEMIRVVLVPVEQWALPGIHLVEKNLLLLLLLACLIFPPLIFFDCGQTTPGSPLHSWLGRFAPLLPVQLPPFLSPDHHLLLPWLILPPLPSFRPQKLLPILKLLQKSLFLVRPRQLLVWLLNSPVEVGP